MRSSGKVSLFVGGLAVANTVVGLLAIVPTALLLSLLAYAGSGPYSPQTNHTYATILGRVPPFEVDTDEAGIVAFLVLGAAVLLGLIFLAANAGLSALRPAGAAGIALWRWAALVSLLPSLGYLVWFALTP